MMRRISNGEPVFHQHHCMKEDAGRSMSAEVYHDFTVKCLMDEYADCKVETQLLPKVSDFSADFRIVRKDRGVNVLVVCRDRNGKIPYIDFSWLIREYRQTGDFSRVTVADSWCIAEGIDDPSIPVCGGSFCFKYQSMGVNPDEKNGKLDRKYTAVELAAKYAQTWNSRDASIIAPYLDKDFHYGSDWVFDELPSRQEYLEYFEGKLRAIVRTDSNVQACVGRDSHTGDVAVLLEQGGRRSAMTLEAKDGRLTSAHMTVDDGTFKPFDPEDELYMSHGDHISAVLPAEEFVQDHIGSMIQKAWLWRKTRATACLFDPEERETTVFSLYDGDGTMGFLIICAANEEKGNNEFVSAYPMMAGEKVTVHVDRVMEWDNMIEATVLCSVGDFSFAFFPVDYYVNKSVYQAGGEIAVDLSAIAILAQEGERGFSFEGQKAVDWLSKIGQDPDYDENGNVVPVRFSLEDLVAYLSLDFKAPDEAEFQSKVCHLRNEKLCGVDFCCGDIKIHNGEGHGDICVPLYFRRDFVPGVQDGDPLRGVLWLTGNISGGHEQMKPVQY